MRMNALSTGQHNPTGSEPLSWLSHQISQDQSRKIVFLIHEPKFPQWRGNREFQIHAQPI